MHLLFHIGMATFTHDRITAILAYHLRQMLAAFYIKNDIGTGVLGHDVGNKGQHHLVGINDLAALADQHYPIAIAVKGNTQGRVFADWSGQSDPAGFPLALDPGGDWGNYHRPHNTGESPGNPGRQRAWARNWQRYHCHNQSPLYRFFKHDIATNVLI